MVEGGVHEMSAGDFFRGKLSLGEGNVRCRGDHLCHGLRWPSCGFRFCFLETGNDARRLSVLSAVVVRVCTLVTTTESSPGESRVCQACTIGGYKSTTLSSALDSNLSKTRIGHLVGQLNGQLFIMNRVNILGVKIDKITKSKALEKVAEFLNSDKQNKIFTPNPEMLVDSVKDINFKEVLNGGDLNICDGFGITLVTRGKLKRIPGVDFMQDICELAEKEGKSIYLLGSNSDEVVKKTAEVLQEKYPLLKIVGFSKGLQLANLPTCQLEYSQDENEDLIHDIILKAPDILFVAFGHGKQEKWIEENLVDLPSVKIAMGVGGSFDFISGKAKRAPKWMRKIGLEWFYRLMREPKRFFRIWNAVIMFLFLVLFNRYTD